MRPRRVRFWRNAWRFGECPKPSLPGTAAGRPPLSAESSPGLRWSPSLISRIIAGIAPVTPETARQLAASLRHYSWHSAAALQLLGVPYPDK